MQKSPSERFFGDLFDKKEIPDTEKNTTNAECKRKRQKPGLQSRKSLLEKEFFYRATKRWKNAIEALKCFGG